MEAIVFRVALLLGVGLFVGAANTGQSRDRKGAAQAPLPDGRGSDLLARVGFAEQDITPKVGDKNTPVWIAGFGKGRKATGVHDPLLARAVVLQHGDKKIAIVSVDLVGLFHESVARVRQKLPGFTYVLISSTHNHEGPDTLGLWGANLFQSGIDPDYLKSVEERIVAAVNAAAKGIQSAVVEIGTARDADLLHDGREPYVKHDELVALRFLHPKSTKNIGVIVQWNCHPETLNSKNTLLSADFVGYTVKHLQDRYKCPVLYLTGTVGGLMTSLHIKVQDDKGVSLKDGTFEKTARYGELVGKLAEKALGQAKAIRLVPFDVRSRDFFLPVDNPLYQLGWELGVLSRDSFVWSGDPFKAEPGKPKDKKQRMCIRSEVAYLRLGELDVACLPGEIYPELVLDKVQDPPDKGADFPDAPSEPAIYKQMKRPHRMIVGLANDEIGYIIPKRQWDEKAPFCYGRKKAQYGEENSLGPDTAPILCAVFRDLAAK
jgi:hypothetical protein